MVITIDGPAGAGKSTISQMFAQSINFKVLDTGAMYRCAALLQKRTNASIEDPIFQQQILSMTINFDDENKVFLNDEDVSTQIRIPEIDLLASRISAYAFVRQHMAILQRKFAKNKNLVAEGRDMGSHVFPDATIKFYLTANSLIRAQRRASQLQQKGIIKSVSELQTEIEKRDQEDSSRKINPLCVPDNAVVIDTSDMDLQSIIKEMLTYYHQL